VRRLPEPQLQNPRARHAVWQRDVDAPLQATSRIHGTLRLLPSTIERLPHFQNPFLDRRTSPIVPAGVFARR
jgi:hypothetical protein